MFPIARSLARPAVAVFSALALTACASTMSVSSHVERGLDFSRYRTWDWGPADTLPTGDPRLDANPFFKDHMQGAVEKGLASRGLGGPSSANPDLLLHYHAAVNQRLDVTSADTSRGYGYDGSGAAVGQYEAGTVVIDIVDARTKRVIWRGWAQDTIEGSLKSEDKMAKQIDEAVTRMLTQLPPRR